jgi:DNA invertase Pin-like site-specific DNA recombinase
MKKAAIYLRVSSEQQAAEGTVSIEQQEEVCRRLCEAQGFSIAGVYVDKEKYKATLAPKKGKPVQPSGTRTDRPGFQQLLAQVEAGDIDAIVAFDSSRIGRHLRVLGAVANSLDLANQRRNGRGEVAIWEADKNNSLNRLMLSIMITIAQEENETRVRRTRMGKIGTLERGLWPNQKFAFGYKLTKADRGYKIEVDEKQAAIVRFIFAEALNSSALQIRSILIARGYEQPERGNKLDWHLSYLQRILTNKAYIGRAVWEFENGESVEVECPRIIEDDLFKAVQKAMETRKAKSQGALKIPALLHHIAYCAECGRRLSVHTYNKYSYKIASGERVYKEVRGLPVYQYVCNNRRYKEIEHSQIVWNGNKVDEELWRLVVDKVIKNPDEIKKQVALRQEELQQNHEDTEGSIERCEREIKALQDGRQRLINQLDKGIIEDDEFEAAMLQKKKQLKYWQEERGRLLTLRDEQKTVEDGLNVMVTFLKHLEARLADLDRPLKGLPTEEKMRIMTERQEIIQTICERVYIQPGGLMRIEGLIDTPQTDTYSSPTIGFDFLRFILVSTPQEAIV